MKPHAFERFDPMQSTLSQLDSGGMAFPDRYFRSLRWRVARSPECLVRLIEGVGS